MTNKLSYFILAFQVLYCNCQTTTLTPVDPKINEGNNVTFVCTVSSVVEYVTWKLAVNDTTSYTTAMGSYKSKSCALGTSVATVYLSDTTKYAYECNSTVYQVTVKNVQRSQHDDEWSCFVPNQISVPKSTMIVQYKAVVTSFTINENGRVTVDENARGVRFKCEADGKPIPTVRLTNSHGDFITATTQTLNHVIDVAKCLDADTYSCSASNKYNVEASVKSLQLYVRCGPRAADTVEENLKSEIGASFTFIFNAIAYPKPAFTWWIWDTDNNEWSELSNDGNITIQSSNLQSSLTITKVTLMYFTSYKLEITNDVGTMTQHYTLSQYG